MRESQSVWTLCLFPWIRKYCSASELHWLSSSTNLRHSVCNVPWVIHIVVATNLREQERKWEKERERMGEWMNVKRIITNSEVQIKPWSATLEQVAYHIQRICFTVAILLKKCLLILVKVLTFATNFSLSQQIALCFQKKKEKKMLFKKESWSSFSSYSALTFGSSLNSRFKRSLSFQLF